MIEENNVNDELLEVEIEESVEVEGLGIWGAIAWFLIWFAFQFGAGIIAGLISVFTGSESLGILITIFSILANIGFVVLAANRHGEHFKYELKLNPLHMVIGLMAIFSYRFLYDSTFGVLLMEVELDPNIEAVFNSMLNSPWRAILEIIILAPLFEEFIFRGLILERMISRKGQVVALITSSVLFSIMHLNLHQMVNALFVGLIFGFFYIKTRNLTMAIYLHFINNAYVLIASYIPVVGITFVESYSMVHLLVGAVMCTLTVLLYSRTEFNNQGLLTGDI